MNLYHNHQFNKGSISYFIKGVILNSRLFKVVKVFFKKVEPGNFLKKDKKEEKRGSNISCFFEDKSKWPNLGIQQIYRASLIWINKKLSPNNCSSWRHSRIATVERVINIKSFNSINNKVWIILNNTQLCQIKVMATILICISIVPIRHWFGKKKTKKESNMASYNQTWSFHLNISVIQGDTSIPSKSWGYKLMLFSPNIKVIYIIK